MKYLTINKKNNIQKRLRRNQKSFEKIDGKNIEKLLKFNEKNETLTLHVKPDFDFDAVYKFQIELDFFFNLK